MLKAIVCIQLFKGFHSKTTVSTPAGGGFGWSWGYPLTTNLNVHRFPTQFTVSRHFQPAIYTLLYIELECTAKITNGFYIKAYGFYTETVGFYIKSLGFSIKTNVFI